MIIIVDENDNQVGVMDREKVVDEIYRVASLRITNSKGEILLARRAYSKKHDPGKWGPAVAGTLDEGETYESNIYKEAKEELGITNVEFKKGEKARVDAKWHYFTQRFYVQLDWPLERFNPDPGEVAEVKWFGVDELKHELAAHPDEFLNSVRTHAYLF